MPSGTPCKSIKAKKMYEGMVKDGMPKDKAAAIANSWARDDGILGPGSKTGKGKGKKGK